MTYYPDSKVEYTPAYVVRFYYHSESEAAQAHAQLENLGIFGDYLESKIGELCKWKVVFAETELVAIKVAQKQLSIKPRAAEIFDYLTDVVDGIGIFKPLNQISFNLIRPDNG